MFHHWCIIFLEKRAVLGRTQAQQHSDWRDGFLFLGNQMALDFLNTHPVADGKEVELLPDFDAVLRWFQAAGELNSGEAGKLRRQWSGSAHTTLVVDMLRDLRERLRAAVLAWEAGEAVRRSVEQELNRLMAEHPMLRRLGPSGGGKYGIELWFRCEKPEDLFAPLAYAAATLFAEADPNRVRKCESCVLHFHDTSKIGIRRWCSMKMCGNRSKVAAYQNRRRRVSSVIPRPSKERQRQ
jgi:predicted RNA-binding Zn ribbon-like protein